MFLFMAPILHVIGYNPKERSMKMKIEVHTIKMEIKETGATFYKLELVLSKDEFERFMFSPNVDIDSEGDGELYLNID